MGSNNAVEIFKKHYNEWLTNPLRMTSGYDYEKTYSETMQKIEHEVLQSSVGSVPKSQNIKKNSKQVMEK
jgi:hypothetical protein